MRYFTADLHLNHTGVIEYDDRPYSSVEKMNQCLIDNWNAIITKADIVYILGDFCWSGANTAMIFLQQLKGQIHLIRGNHNSLNLGMRRMFAFVSWQKKIKIDEDRYVLSHYAFRTWAGKDKGVVNLHGHSHGNLEPMKNAIDVGCNVWDYKPISIEVIRKRLKIEL